MQNYIDMFKSSVIPIIDKIEKLVADKNTEKIGQLLHGFHTRLLMMGMNDQRSEVLQIEIHLKQGLPDEILTSRLAIFVNQLGRQTMHLYLRVKSFICNYRICFLKVLGYIY